jgi:SHS2 domain-containing protein
MLHNASHYAGRVLVEVFSLQSEAEVAELFTDINKAEPVSERQKEAQPVDAVTFCFAVLATFFFKTPNIVRGF